VRGVPSSVRHDSTKLIALLSLVAAIAAATPTVQAVPVPKVPLHAVYTVETNKLGQVVRVVSAQASSDQHFNEATRGNALQAFIRRPDGSAVAGVFKLIYDYTPTTKMVHRDVQLVHAGGVDPNAKGAVTVQIEKNEKSAKADTGMTQQQERAAEAASKIHMPDFNAIVSPEPSPSK
jgi:hypothetical protein